MNNKYIKVFGYGVISLGSLIFAFCTHSAVGIFIFALFAYRTFNTVSN